MLFCNTMWLNIRGAHRTVMATAIYILQAYGYGHAVAVAVRNIFRPSRYGWQPIQYETAAYGVHGYPKIKITKYIIVNESGIQSRSVAFLQSNAVMNMLLWTNFSILVTYLFLVT
jgi:hypothetical protein